MRTVNVDLADRGYNIGIGDDLLAASNVLESSISGNRTFIVSNDVVAPLYISRVESALEALNIEHHAVLLPDGEAQKNIESLDAIYTAMLKAKCDRSTTVLALGGGVIGDLAGFAAATYQRGVPFVQLPTTLLSQVDSSVGGKTGINHPLGKNMIGAFWQPRGVIADTKTLLTLPDRELSAGLAEVIKYGIIRDLPFFEWLEKNMPNLLARQSDALAFAIERCCRNKAEVVAADEFETAKDGGRALLNLGHTFGHAIETAAGYGVWLHGEAVAAGTMMAAVLSRQLGWLSSEHLSRIRDLLIAAKLPVHGLPGQARW